MLETGRDGKRMAKLSLGQFFVNHPDGAGHILGIPAVPEGMGAQGIGNVGILIRNIWFFQVEIQTVFLHGICRIGILGMLHTRSGDE